MKLLSRMMMMLIVTLSVALFGPSGAQETTQPASPSAPANNNNASMKALNMALTLENMEYTFYQQGLQQYNACDFEIRKIYDRLVEIRDQEAQHVQTLTNAAQQSNNSIPPNCSYQFNYSNPVEFIQVARVLEMVGVSGYDGAIRTLQDTQSRGTSATIATIEARHAAFLNMLTSNDPFPTAFDVPLDPDQVSTILSQYWTNCTGQELGLSPNPTLNATLQNNATIAVVQANTTLQQGTQYYCSWLYSNANNHTALTPNSTCDVPSEIKGDTYLFLTNSSTPMVFGDNADVVAGPTVVTVIREDNTTQSLFGGRSGRNVWAGLFT